MAKYNMNGWLDTAMEQVRCHAEKKAIRAELLGHMEDKQQDLIDGGMEPSQAARAAVVSMGDPVEVGQALDRAHPAIWSRLYTAAKAVVVILCMVVLVSVLFGALDDISRNYPLKMVTYDPAEQGSERVVILEDTYGPIRQNGYTVDVTQVYWEPVVEYTYADGVRRDENVLFVDIKVYNPRPWAVTPLFMDRLEVLGDEDTLFHDLGVNMPLGGRITGVLDSWDRTLADYRYWGAWYFTVELTGVEPGEEVTLYLPGNDRLKWTFQVGVIQ